MRGFPLSIAFALLLAGTLAPFATEAKAGVVRVAVYRGPAGCEGCSETVGEAIQSLGSRYRVDFVGPAEAIDITPETLRRYDVYVQPGGGQDIPAAFASFGDARVEAIQTYVAGGGRYLGLCMGAYLASGYGLGLIEQDLDSEVGRPGFPVETIESTAVSTRWNGQTQTVFFQDGAYLPKARNDPGFRTIATYENGDIAAARYTFRRGVVVLSGPHPEADESWFEENGIPLAKMPGDDLLRSLFMQLGG
ncbi:BPL-N domain-containing protein [Aureimonas sp. AU40]|uniref:BPL-N domain-containing protein n=1 Tax=Aureimonas sp. AU40 TaxID=1637747 RepID=UPI000782C13F|nr:BPL-N domain-containing protein [Aureimonas sp. AU40]